MKKTFPLAAPGREPARVIDAIKHDVRKYVKRERRKPVPEGADFWDFACRVGPSRDTAETKRINELNPAIDAVASAGATEIYLEIIAVHGHHVRHPAAAVAPVPPAETPPPAEPLA